MVHCKILLLITTFILANTVNTQPDIEPIIEPVRDCNMNAIWSYCKPPCPRSCDSINNPNPIRCFSLLCQEGCNCIEGYVRKSENSQECILEKDCPKENQNRCGRHAVWNDCASYCPRNCEGLIDPDPIMCPAVCVKGCVCLPGYIRQNLTDPNCIPEKDCPYIKRVDQ